MHDRYNQNIAGVDEVGRGCLFGPVVAAAVILSPTVRSLLLEAGVQDSKKIAPKKRRILAECIRQNAIACSVGIASVAEIDRLNILQASLLAMKRAILKLSVPPDLCEIDGRQSIPNLPYPQRTVVRGDSQVLAIASASIVAKVWRDDLIVRLAQQYPEYDLASNKGYGSSKHRTALKTYGVSQQHRRSFRPCSEIKLQYNSQSI
ncbi:ribonuclease HII [Geitlerinema sp. PCC 9228]|jgi:ribonuclease HII|uniref:ribonuclease HII n=1 Tax=Geitlerinema sp. PCC 9228 TaxID=111611 RepID=UPI0008F993A8|nr:ribonuclease HII [Geitlerinema sp. PCC 9228]